MPDQIDLPSFVATTISVENLFQKVFPVPAMTKTHQDWTYFQSRVILTPWNETIADINDRILPKMGGTNKNLRIYRFCRYKWRRDNDSDRISSRAESFQLAASEIEAKGPGLRLCCYASRSEVAIDSIQDKKLISGELSRDSEESSSNERTQRLTTSL